MGGGAMPQQGGKHGKKSLDAVINVVPAIDLLSCCITFLLYTAVWTQISRLQVTQFGAGMPDPPGAEQQKPFIVTLNLGERAMVLATTAGQSWEIPVEHVTRAAGENEQPVKVLVVKDLVDKLKVIRQANPEAVSVTISSEDALPYGDLIQVIDSCVGQGLTAVSVAGG